MQVIVVVLNKIDYLDDLLAKLKKAGVSGGTIIESTGMMNRLGDSDESYILGSLRLFLDNPRPESKTLFFIVKDSQIEIVRKTVDEVLGGIDNPDTGIMFGIPISFADGLIKRNY
ncbi:MAG: hypothetical protein LUH02_05945 [Erysipelotrichaceae bacterium]|nr:hypothetical protein [Erysipelotrichaceae bacterium]